MADTHVRALRVPEEDRPILGDLLNLTRPRLDALVGVIDSIATQGDLEPMPAEIGRNLGVAQEDAERMASVVVNLYRSYEKAGSLDQLKAKLQAAIESDAERFGHIEWSQAANALGRILSNDDFAVAAKAAGLWREHERSLCRARIVSDLRPIFDRDVTRVPRAAMIVHELRITFHRGDDHDTEEFYIALTPHHIGLLRTLLDRAETKEGSLRKLAEDSNFKIIDI